MIILNKNCGECLPCSSVQSVAELYAFGFSYTYNTFNTNGVSSSSDSYNILGNPDRLFGDVCESNAFEWKNKQNVPDCSRDDGFARTLSFSYNNNAYFGLILEGKVGDIFNLNVAYYQYTTDYTLTEVASNYRDWCGLDTSTSGVSLAGYINISLTIETSDVIAIKDSSSGKVYAGYNITEFTSSFGVGEMLSYEGKTYTVSNNSDFALPSPPTNTSYYICNNEEPEPE